MPKRKSQIAWQNSCGSHIFFHVWLNGLVLLVCSFLWHFLHIWPISEKLSNTDCFPHFLHIWQIFGNSATLTVFSFFSHSFSICGKYLEMVQKLINSRLDPEPPTLQAHVCHLSQFCIIVQLGLLFFTLQAAQVHIFQLNNEESVMGNNIPMSQTC